LAAKDHALKRDSALKEIIEILKQVIQMDNYYLVIEKHSNSAVDQALIDSTYDLEWVDQYQSLIPFSDLKKKPLHPIKIGLHNKDILIQMAMLLTKHIIVGVKK
jgi:hypothetical protein